jgi:quinol monooxygenase YgiN
MKADTMVLTILAQIHVVPGKEDALIAEMHKLIAATKQEAGCLQYDMHIDNDNPGFIMFYENWETRDLWLDHMKAPHLAAYNAATKGWIQSLTLNEMTRAG